MKSVGLNTIVEFFNEGKKNQPSMENYLVKPPLLWCSFLLQILSDFCLRTMSVWSFFGHLVFSMNYNLEMLPIEFFQIRNLPCKNVWLVELLAKIWKSSKERNIEDIEIVIEYGWQLLLRNSEISQGGKNNWKWFDMANKIDGKWPPSISWF